MMKHYLIYWIASLFGLSACITQPQYQTVYEPVHIDAVHAVQVSDVVSYGMNEEHVLSTGEYRPSMGKIRWVRPDYAIANSDENIKHIYFNTASSKITKSGVGEVSGNLKNMNSVHLLGYADPRGSQAYNLNLSKRRVQSAEKYFRKNGVEVLSTEYYGEDELPEYSLPF